MHTPRAKSEVCGQDCATPILAKKGSPRGQDIASPQDQMDEAKLLERTTHENAKSAWVEQKTVDTNDKKSTGTSAAKRSTRSAASGGPSTKTAKLCVEDRVDDANAAAASPSANTAAVASAPAKAATNSFSVASDKRVFKKYYHLKKYISKALYGNIFTCVAKSGEAFACKVMNNSKMKEQLRRNVRIRDNPDTEFKLLSLLAERPHPNLLSLVDKFADNKRTYFVLPLARGGDLISSVQRHSAGLGDTLTREIFKKLALALQHLHGMGWQHGDVSLENILVMSPGDFSSVTLCDFGLATRMGSPGRTAGKSMYMAPEVLAADKVKHEDKASSCSSSASVSASTHFAISAAQDVFSLGVSMFMTLFGFPPFDFARKSDPNYRDLHANKEKYLNRLAQWGVCPTKTRLPIVSLLMDMMSKDVEKRPTMATILNRLQDLES